MKIVVTGAAGFIGFSLTRKLLARGDEVIGIDCLNDYYSVALKHARRDRLIAAGGNRNIDGALQRGAGCDRGRAAHRRNALADRQ